MTYSQTTEIAVTALGCNYCGATPGQWCVSRSVETRAMAPTRRRAERVTGRASYVHAARTRPIDAAWQVGFAEGADMVARVALAMLNSGKSGAEVAARLDRWAA